MIHLVDQALEALFRDVVPLPRANVDLSFAAPDKTWSAGLNRPTVNCFLWDVGRDDSSAGAGQQSRAVDGRVDRRPTPARIELSYVITSWAREERDEHQLLGAVMTAVLANRTVPDQYLSAGLMDSRPIGLVLSRSDDRKASEFWSALGGQLKPGINLKVQLAVEAVTWSPAAPVVRAVEVDATEILPAAPAGPGGDRDPATRARPNGSEVAELPVEP